MTSLTSTAIAQILAAAYDDAANARVPAARHQLYLPDLDIIGALWKPNDCLSAWMRQVGIGSLTTTLDVLNEDHEGILGIQDIDPVAGMELRIRRQRLAAAMHHIIIATPYLSKMEERYFANADIARRLEQGPRRHNRLRLACTANTYQLPILSGNRYYVHLAEDIPMPAGVFNPANDEWLVPPA